MYHPKVFSAFNNIEKQSSKICEELDAFMGNVSKWVDELGGVLEKEYTASKDSTFVLLPKTPSQKRTYYRKGINAFNSKCSVMTATLSQNGTCNLDDTVSLKTRGAKRAATSKISQLSNATTYNLPYESIMETAETENNTKDVPNATFVMPTAGTRTKPVLKNTQSETGIAESQRNEKQVVETSGNSEKELSFKSVASSPDGVTRGRTSRSHSGSRLQRSSPKDVPNTDREPESPTERPSKVRLSRSLNGSPVTRTARSNLGRSQSGSPVWRSSNAGVPRSPRDSPVTNKSGRSNCRSTERTCVVHEDMELDENVMTSTRIMTAESNENVTVTVIADTEEVSEDVQVPKKKRKIKKDEEMKENVEEMADTGRITRTKSKALKKMAEENETKQADLSAFAKKLINRAKMTSLKKNQLAALIECNSSTPTNGPPGHLGNHLPFGDLTTSKSKYHLLLSSAKKQKTPLAAHPNGAANIAKAPGDKDRTKAKLTGRDSSVENLPRSTTKPSPKDGLEKETKLKSKKKKEEEAALKRQNAIKAKQKELKRKNELKHQMAMKQREKLEEEKYNNMIQLEKEKEERHKLILQERQIKQQEEAFKKKMLTQQKIAETLERRRMEEEARLAKLREMEAEEQRLALEKQKEQERQEKRAQERMALKKAREEYEQQLKQELEAERIRAEKALTAKKCLPSTTKRQNPGQATEDKREWDYKPRHEEDYGLEDEHSEIDEEDEKPYDDSKPAVAWAKRIMEGKPSVVMLVTLEMLAEFMPCYQKSPDIHKMFRMSPSKRIKRSSSAIWNTSSS